MTSEPLVPLLDAARGAGLSTVSLDLSGVSDKRGFMGRCARALDLPDWFGHNWDALADCLTDLPRVPSTPGLLLVVSGWQAYAQAAPQEWIVAQEVFSDAVAYARERSTGLEIILAFGPAAATERGGA
ncbi:barstar family protein [Streptomyces sp. NPDC059037]|uniref:barstar family protein n=1 Tax=Streptomyces sp. NPDC059037 TaxID=3346710 RepID=UPI0036B865B7